MKALVLAALLGGSDAGVEALSITRYPLPDPCVTCMDDLTGTITCFRAKPCWIDSVKITGSLTDRKDGGK